MIRTLFLSLCLGSALTAATLETLDPWEQLRLAPPLPAAPEPEPLAVPDLPLELSSLLQFVMAFAHPTLVDEEFDAVLAALTPQYEIFLRGFATVPSPVISAATNSLTFTPVSNSALSLGDPVGLSAAPEPGTWALLAAGLAALLAARVALPHRQPVRTPLRRR